MVSDGAQRSAGELRHDFTLRTWVIEHLGPGENADWSPEALGAGTLAAIAMSPSEAATLATKLARAVTAQELTAHLEWLVGHLQPGSTRDRLLPWIETRHLLP